MEDEQTDEQTELGTFYVDFTPNHEKNEINLQNAETRLRVLFEARLEESVERGWDLPPVWVILQGEYLDLLIEARDLYIDGRFYSCVVRWTSTSLAHMADQL